MVFMAFTLSRILSGVSIGINVERTTTLTTSDAPNTTSDASDNTIELDTAKIMVEIPKEITAINIIYPRFSLKAFVPKKLTLSMHLWQVLNATIPNLRVQFLKYYWHK